MKHRALFSFATATVLSFILVPACNDAKKDREADQDDVDEDGDSGTGGDTSVCDAITTCEGGAGAEGENCGEDALKLKLTSLGVKAGGATDFAFLPSESSEDMQFLVTMRGGSLAAYTLGEDRAERTGTWELDEVFDTGACGLTNIVLDPEFSENGFLYLTYCTDPINNFLYRFKWSWAEGLSDKTLILQTAVEKPKDEWHLFGSLGFEEDGETLWLMMGDHTTSETAQDITTLPGSLLRIIPNRGPEGGYEPAEGNMDMGLGGASSIPAPEVYAYGFRSPWRASRDESGRFYVADVGEYKIEEVNLVSYAGQNLGWNITEGPCTDECDGLTDPLIHYTRSTEHPYVLEDPETEPATKRAVWVGEVYQNPTTDRYCGLMDDAILFGDLFTGWVRALKADEDGHVVLDQSVAHLPSVTQARKGPDGYLYLITLGGSFYRAELNVAEE